MKSVYRVYLDFVIIERQVRRLKGIAQSEGTIANDFLSGIIRQLSQSWEGENGEEFLNKCQDLQNKLNDQSVDLNTIADTVDRMARNEKEAELRAIRIAQMRSTGSGGGGGGR